ncbi:unnamed protein product [Acanthoscelides obtectus]|uniref:FAM234A/B beta-propeller domain-containing protein n=1 Tax=Acanthoscelides obtectus TaxID=200917 RepID=A0A9P0KZ30_ACAOB|nr:unnamed protein product [Acanthoscelides obtectus]CAK1673129.1 hypothetical protein AOBTE_LOCUS29246 [Acanthoscelides obtectus]
MAHVLQGVYAPLPQSLSDSDSDKEISMEPVCGNYNGKHSDSRKTNSFSYLQNGHQMVFSEIVEDMHQAKLVNPKMSAGCKFAFAFSIILCFLPVVIFLWVLPCSESNTCPVKISNWEIQLENIEFQGKCNLVDGPYKGSILNIALMYKGSFNSHMDQKNGIALLKGRDGSTIWNYRQKMNPSGLNCSIIDVSGNGIHDCLVIDENGLKAIESLTGETLWYAHSAQEKSIPKLDMPVKLKDMDDDNIDELLAIYEKHSLLLISGKDGKALQNIKVLTPCFSIEELHRVGEFIRYLCNAENEGYYEISLDNIEAMYKKNQEIIPKVLVFKNESGVFQTGNRKLIVKNENTCPHCHSTITLYGNNSKEWSYTNAYTMRPVPYSLRPTETNMVALKGHIYGFILKIWEWKEHSRKLAPGTRVYKRSVAVHNETYHLNNVTERFILIVFNENDTRIINVSMTDLCIICNGPDRTNCQPNYEDQQDSLSVVDLDDDGALELISFYSTYERRDEEGYEAYYLVSKLNVFRLESELPKLYGNK